MIKSFAFGLLTLIALLQPSVIYSYGEKGIFIGTIQFPTTIDIVPSIRIYYAGRKIATEFNDAAKKLTFSITEYKQRTFFCLLITPDIEFASPDNTIGYLKLKRNYPYKFYVLELVPQVIAESETKRKKFTKPTEKITYNWYIRELILDPITGRIPDETIIIRYHPELFQSFEGGNLIEFPKLVIRNDALKLLGSEAKLHEISNAWFLAALNTDTIHETVLSEFKITPQSKTVLTMAA